MKLKQRSAAAVTLSIVSAAALIFLMPLGVEAQPPQGAQPQQGGRGGPPAPTGPMAGEKFKNIQALTNVQADQLEISMRYVSAATGFTCISCHVQDESGQWAYEKDDKRTKQTARNMMKMVNGVNAGNFGVQVECATCHAGHNRPTGLPMAEMLTAQQVAQLNAAPPAGGPGGGFQGAPGGSGGRGGGRGGPPAPPVDDLINKYLEAVGGRPAIEKLQSLSLTGVITNRAGQTAGFTIEEKGTKYREVRQSKPDTLTLGFDGSSGWSQTGTKVADLTGYLLDQSLRLGDPAFVLNLGQKYTNLMANGRPFQINGKDTISVTGRAGIVTDQYYFESASGLLVRRVITSRTPMGSLREQFDYADYRPAGSVRFPFEIKRTTWEALDTLKISDAKANVALDDTRFAKPK